MINSICKKIKVILNTLGNIFISLSYRAYRSPQELRVHEYKRDSEFSILYDFNLDKNSIVVDVGGYQGDWSAEISARYTSNIYIFEPVKDYYLSILRRFNRNPKIKVFKYGLADKRSKEKICLANDGSSTYKSKPEKEEIILQKASSFLAKQNIKDIDLMKINIEGGEYALCDDLIKNNVIKKINNLMIQFHDIVPDAKNKMQKLHKRLKKTHHLTFQYEFVWENWERNY